MKQNKMFTITEVKITSIYSENRARTNFGDLTILKESITNSGLFNPIQITPEGRLIAGERRLTAFSELGFETIPARIMPDLDPDDIMIIERMENEARKQFEWHEELELRYKLHLYWKEKALPEEWGYRSTAKKLNCSVSGLSTDLTLAEALKSFPELKKLSTKGKARDAYKKLGEQADAIMTMKNLSPEERDRMQKLISGNKEIMKKNSSAKSEPLKATHKDEVPNTDGITTLDRSLGEHQVDVMTNKEKPEAIYAVEDLNSFIPKIPDNSTGFIELDPPYAIDFNTNYGKTGKIQAKATDWDTTTLFDFYTKMLPILHQKLLPSSWILCWTGKEHWLKTNEIAAASGFKVQMPGIWVKPGGSTNTPKTNMISNYEMFLLFRKGKATFNLPSMLGTIQFDSPSSSKRIHQWEKPLSMYNYLLQVFGRPGSIFLSPFAGSGNSMIAAGLAGMIPMGCDNEQKYIYMFYERYNNHFLK